MIHNQASLATRARSYRRHAIAADVLQPPTPDAIALHLHRVLEDFERAIAHELRTERLRVAEKIAREASDVLAYLEGCIEKRIMAIITGEVGEEG